MARINLPRVYVEDDWTAFLKDLHPHFFYTRKRKQRQIAAAKKAHGPAHGPGHRNGKFGDSPGSGVNFAWIPIRSLQTSEPPGSGEYGRVELIARLRKLLEEPWCVFGDRKTWGAIPQYRRAGYVLNDVLSLANVFQKFFRPHFIYQSVRVSVARNLMPLVPCLADQLREIFSHPAQEKTRHTDLFSGKNFQQGAEIPAHVGGKGLPLSHILSLGRAGNMKPVFNIHRKQAFSPARQGHCGVSFVHRLFPVLPSVSTADCLP